MKTTLLVTNIRDFDFQGKKGTTCYFMLERLDKVHTSSISDEVSKTLKSNNLPAIFEADIEPVIKYNIDENGQKKSVQKYLISSLKLVKYVPIFKQ